MKLLLSLLLSCVGVYGLSPKVSAQRVDEQIWRQGSDICSVITTCCSEVDALSNCMLGTQITQAMIPYTISAPGHYYLCGSVTASSGGVAINIIASDVFLNLNGFTVTNTANVAIFSLFSNANNVTIENGSVSGALGIELDGLTNVTLRNLDISSSAGTTCFLGTITNLVMEDCYVTANGAALVCVALESIVGGRLENVSVYNTASTGFFIENINPATTLELTNCTADTVTGDAFLMEASGGIVLRGCVAAGSNRGFVTDGNFNDSPTGLGALVFEDCIATDSALAGFWMEQINNVILRNCIAESTSAGSGFHSRAAVSTLYEGCISRDNAAHGFHLDAAIGGNVNCIFDKCLGHYNGVDGFHIDPTNVNAGVTGCLAAKNSNNGIANYPASTYIVDTRSSNSAATALNPAYNLNGAFDLLSGALVIVAS